MYKTIIRPILCYGCETWTMNSKSEQLLDIFERKILRRIYDPIQVERIWRMQYNSEIYILYNDIKLSKFIKLKRPYWTGHVTRMGPVADVEFGSGGGLAHGRLAR